MKIFNVFSSRHIGDIFLDSIVLNAIQKLRKDIQINLIVDPKYQIIAVEIQKFIRSKINIKSFGENFEGQYVEISPMPRSINHLIPIIPYFFKKHFFSYVYYNSFKCSGFGIKKIYLLFQYYLLIIFGSKKVVTNQELQGYIVNEKKYHHILDLLVLTSSDYFKINKELIKKKIIENIYLIRKNFIDESLYSKDLLLIPSIGGTGIAANKSFTNIFINKTIKKFSLDNGTKFIIGKFGNKEFLNFRKKEFVETKKYSSLHELLSLFKNKKLIILPDSFPAHLAVFLGKKTEIYIPGYNFASYFPYPEWFPTSKDLIFKFTYKYIDCFACNGICDYKLRCMNWNEC